MEPASIPTSPISPISASFVLKAQNDTSASARLRTLTFSQLRRPYRRRCRIALYSHDTMGLGHLRRNLLIAQTFAHSALHTAGLMIVGTGQAGTFPLPSDTDHVILPALQKQENGCYQSRHLPVALQEIIALREQIICAALESFTPDVFIVDNVPRGAVGELNRVLAFLRRQGHTRCVLGLRDVLDAPDAVRREWDCGAYEQAVRDYYDAVWVYGDPAVYDPIREYHFSPDIAAKTQYVGYLDQSLRLANTQVSANANASDPLASLPPGRLILCLVGGGQDGARLAEAFARADLPTDTNGVIVTGPFMAPEIQRHLQHMASQRPQLHVLGTVAEPVSLVQRADRVIAMGGYNTVCEAVSFQKQTLIVPRVTPRQEQLIRAERFQSLGLLDVLHPEQATPQALSMWMKTDTAPRGKAQIDINGLERLPGLLAKVLRLPAQREARSDMEDL